MPSKMKRHLRAEYTKGARALPRTLAFLEYAKYSAVVEHIGSERTSYAVELKPSVLKQLLDAQDEIKASEKKLRELRSRMVDARAEIVRLEQALSEAAAHNERLEENNATLMKRLDETPDDLPSERIAKSHMSRIEERGLRRGMRGMQGGLPSLGKRK